MSKVVGFVVGAALIATGLFILPAGVGLFAATAVARSSLMLVIEGGLLIVSQALVDLTMPKQPARFASEMSIALGEQPRVMLVGETFTPGSMVDAFNYGGKYGTDWEVLIIRLADHKCEGLTGFYVNDEYVPYTGNGVYPQFDTHHFELYFRADTTNEALPSVVTTNGPGWVSTDIGESGCDVTVCYLADKPDAKHPAWPGGRPRFGFVVKGKKCYDPRLDDTVTGGSGAHRWDDPSTWEWSENAVICWYNFERGVFANDDTSDETKLLVGRGLTAEESPPETIFAAANLCDEGDGVGVTYDVEAGTHYGTGLGAFSPGFTRFVTLDASGDGFYAIWDVVSRTLLSTGDMPCGVGGFVFTPSGSIYIRPDATHVRTLTSGFALSGAAVTLANAADTIWLAGGLGCLSALTGHNFAQLYNGSTVDAIDVGFKVLSYLDGPDGLPWALGVSGTDIKLAQIDPVASSVIATLTVANASGSGATPYGLANSAGNICLFQGTTILVIDTAGTILDSGSRSGIIDREAIINHDGSDTIWSQNYQYSLLDGSLIQSVTYSDWYSGAGSNMYDPVNNALFGEAPSSSNLNWLFLGTGTLYRVAGPIYANQDYIEVEEMFAAATGGNIVTHEGQVLLEPGQAKSVVATITDDDLLTGSQVSWNQGFLSESNPEWVNTVVCRYVEPSQKWADHAAPVLRDTDDILADGKPREASVPLRLVRYQNQALRVGEINRRLGRIWGRATVILGPRFCELEAGDWISWTSARYGFTKTFRIDAQRIDEKWQNQLTLREIAATAYANDATFPTDESVAVPTVPPPDIGSPDSGDWTLIATTLDSPGASIPALEITGAEPDDENAEAIEFAYWQYDGSTDPMVNPDSIPWTSAGTLAPSTTKVDITSVVGGATYYSAVRYFVSGEPGDWLVLGPVTVTDISTDPFTLEGGTTLLTLEGGVTPIYGG